MPRLSHGLAAVAAALVLVGCGTTPTGAPAPTPTGSPTVVETAVSTATGEPDASPAASPTATATRTSSPNGTPTASETEDATSLDDALIEPDGLGPIQLGMSLNEARAHGWAGRSAVCDRWDASPALVARGVSLTFVDDQLYEIWVRQPTFVTETGIRVGDTLGDAREAYGERLRTEPRPGGDAWFVVEGEHELLFVEEAPGRNDRITSILARTHGTPVIEGC